MTSVFASSGVEPWKAGTLVERHRRQPRHVQLIAVRSERLRQAGHDRRGLAPALRESGRKLRLQFAETLLQVRAEFPGMTSGNVTSVLELRTQHSRPMSLLRRDLERVAIDHRRIERIALALDRSGLRQQRRQKVRVECELLRWPPRSPGPSPHSRHATLSAIRIEQIVRRGRSRSAQQCASVGDVATLQCMRAESEERLWMLRPGPAHFLPQALRFVPLARIGQPTCGADELLDAQ